MDIEYDILSTKEYGSLCKQFETYVKAINLLFENGYHSQCLVLIYSLIDSLSWLQAPKSSEERVGVRYQRWVRMYLLRDSAIKALPIELYGARCALLHEHGIFSRISRSGRGRSVVHCYGEGTLHMNNQEAILHGKPHVIVHENILHKALLGGFELFLGRIRRGKSLSRRVLRKVPWFVNDVRIP